MADQQGTGKHPHKSAAEPYEHHEAPTTKDKGHTATESHNSSGHTTASHTTASHTAGSHTKAETHDGEQGTGKHPHKKASDPKEHHEGAKK